MKNTRLLIVTMILLATMPSASLANESKSKHLLERCASGFNMALTCLAITEGLQCLFIPWSNCANWRREQCEKENAAELQRWQLLWAQGVQGAPHLRDCG